MTNNPATKQDNQSNGNDQNAINLGVKLRKLRESEGLTIDYISSELKLSTEKIESIEAGDLSCFGAKIFARGHLKQYASLLGRPEIVDEGNVHAQDDFPPLVNHLVGEPTVRKHLKKAGKGLAYAGVSLFVVLPTLIWFARGPVQEILERSGLVPQSEIVTRVNIPKINPNQNSENDTVVTESQAPRKMASMALPEGVFDHVNFASKKTEETSNLIVKDDLPEELELQTELNVLPKEQPEEIIKQTFEVADEKIENNLIIDIKQDTWLEVYDGESRMAYGLYHPDRTLNINTTGEMTFVVGNIDGVDIVLHGSKVDLKDHADGNVARFALSQPSD